MGRSHAWLPRGAVFVEPRPMNWGDNLTLIGAMRADRWLTVGTCWGAANTERFTEWVQHRLVPRLRPGDIVVLDNLNAHKAPAVRALIEGCGARLRFLPPVLSRSESHRSRLGADQETDPYGGAADARDPAGDRATRPPRHSSTALSKLVCPFFSRLQSTHNPSPSGEGCSRKSNR